MGGKRSYDLGQRTKLALLRQVHEDSVTARTEMRARIEEEYRERMEQFDYRKSRLMNELRGMGVAKTDIGLAVRLAHWPSLEALYALTAHEYTGAREPVEQYTLWDGPLTKTGRYAFTVNWMEFDGQEYTDPTRFELEFTREDGWDVFPPDPAVVNTPLAHALWFGDVMMVVRWREETANAVVAEYRKRGGVV